MTPYYADDWLSVYQGDCRAVMAELPAESVHCVVTSPPYWGLRDYGNAGQLGLEATPEEYVANLVDVFREVRRVLRSDGTVWLNLGDSYAGSGRGGNPSAQPHLHTNAVAAGAIGRDWVKPPPGLKQKDLVGVPWRVAFALHADGWYLRSDIIWSKPNPMPESVTDRPTKSHEYLFLLSKSRTYHYDAEAVAEPLAETSIERLSQPTIDAQLGSDRVPGKTNGTMKAVGGPSWQERKAAGAHAGSHGIGYLEGSGTQRNVHGAGLSHDLHTKPTRNLRSVWTITTQPYAGAHYAVFPEAIPERCILAGCPENGVVLDPFAGSGTVGRVAQRLTRRAILIDLNPDYLIQAMGRNRDIPLGLVS
jgi:DNA modification methylase